MTAPQAFPQSSESATTAAPHQPQRSAADTKPDRVWPLLRGALLPTLVVGALTVLVAAFVAGSRGAVGALVGALVVVLFSGTGLLALRLVRTADPMLVMVVALGSYLLRIVLFGAAIMLTSTIPGLDAVLDRTATAIAVMVCVAAWLAGEIRAYTRLRIPIYEVELPAASAEIVDAGTTTHASSNPGTDGAHGVERRA